MSANIAALLCFTIGLEPWERVFSRPRPTRGKSAAKPPPLTLSRSRPGVPGAGLSMGGRRSQRRRTGSPARRNRRPRREGRTEPDKYERAARAEGSRAQRRARGGSQARGTQAVREIAFRCARGCAGGHSRGARGEKRGKPRAIWREFAKHPEAAASVLRAASDAFLRKHRLSRLPSRRGYVEWTRQFIFDVKH